MVVLHSRPHQSEICFCEQNVSNYNEILIKDSSSKAFVLSPPVVCPTQEPLLLKISISLLSLNFYACTRPSSSVSSSLALTIVVFTIRVMQLTHAKQVCLRYMISQWGLWMKTISRGCEKSDGHGIPSLIRVRWKRWFWFFGNLTFLPESSIISTKLP